jgi:hypothetical protein
MREDNGQCEPDPPQRLAKVVQDDVQQSARDGLRPRSIQEPSRLFLQIAK